MSRVTINGPRVSLLPFTGEYLTQRYVDWLNDPQLMRFSEQRHRRHTPESNIAYARQFDHECRFLWAIVDRRDGAHVGNINAYLDRYNGVADIGLLIGEVSKQGQGLGREAWIGAIHGLFLAQGARKVTGGCAAANHSMRRIMESAGMTSDGIRVQHLLIDGAYVDVIHMALFIDNFSHDKSYTITASHSRIDEL